MTCPDDTYTTTSTGFFAYCKTQDDIELAIEEAIRRENDVNSKFNVNLMAMKSIGSPRRKLQPNFKNYCRNSKR